MASTSAAGAPSSQNRTSSSPNSTLSFAQKTAAKSTYSSKLASSDAKSRASENSSSTVQRPAPAPKAWQSGVNPLTQTSTSSNQSSTTTTPTKTNTPIQSLLMREGQKVTITLDTGAEFEGHYSGKTEGTYTLKMVVQKKLPSGGDVTNGNSRPGREQPSMSFQKKDVADIRVAGSLPKADGMVQNGHSASFRTDTAISGNRLQKERELQRWVPDMPEEEMDGSLESNRRGGNKSSGLGGWDQFAENERLFGLTTNYDESFYTTTIDKSHPKYAQRLAEAERKAREIEGSVAQHAHVAEERVTDNLGGDDGVDEEDKYSGVRRQQDFPPLSSTNRENKYTPPAKRAPTANSTVRGAPVDPAIISSQLARPDRASHDTSKGSTPKPTPEVKAEDKTIADVQTSAATEKAAGATSTPEVKSASKPETKTQEKVEAKTTPPPRTEAKAAPATGTAVIRTSSPSVKADGLPKGTPSATATVERDVSIAFKSFATQQRQNMQQIRNKAKVDKEVKLNDLKKFADSFKLNIPIPKDLISIIAKDPAKQREIQKKAQRNYDEAQREKQLEAEKKAAAAAAAAAAPAPTSSAQVKPASQAPSTPQGPSPSTSGRQGTGRPAGQTPQGPYSQSFRQERPMQQPTGNQGRSAHSLGQRLRNLEQGKAGQVQPGHFIPGPDGRQPPTGPAHGTDNFSRRSSGVSINPKLNPNSNEFRPNAFAPVFNPNGNNRSTGSSPRSGITASAPTPSISPIPTPSGSLLRRKPAQTDSESSKQKEISTIGHVKSIQPPPEKKWTDNGSFKPAYDTLPTWRQPESDEGERNSTMNQTYKEFLELQPYGSHANPSPHPPNMNPQAHQHQLPFHLQQGTHMSQRQSPRQPPLHMNGNHHGHGPSPSFAGHDDHRMMPSHSAQSYASPRLQPATMTYPSPMAQPAQMAYNQMQYPMVPGQQMAQYRSYSGGHQFVPQQGPMGAPVMIQGPPGGFINTPQGMVPAGPHMPFIPGQANFVPPGGAPPPVMPGTNGYPSPGRGAPMMVSQGSQQGQPMYGMSPAMQYGQPIYAQQQPGQMPNMRVYPPQGQQPFGTSPQQMHQYAQPHRNGPPNNFNKSFQQHGQHAPAQQNQAQNATTPQVRSSEATEEAK